MIRKSFIIIPFLLMVNFSIISAEKLSNFEIDNYLLRQSIFYGLSVSAVEEPSLSVACKRQLVMIAEEVYNRKKWALKLFDASGAPTPGNYWGAKFWLGSHLQCEATTKKTNYILTPNLGPVTIETDEDLPPFPVAYYAAYIRHNNTFQYITHIENEFVLNLGLCLPKSCNEREVEVLLQDYFDLDVFHHGKIFNASYKVDDVRKLVDDGSWMWDLSTILTCGVILIMVLTCAIGTIYDVKFYQPLLRQYEALSSEDYNKYTKKENKPDRNILICFSLYANAKKIGDLRDRPNSVNSLDAMKVILMYYSIGLHFNTLIVDMFDDPVNILENFGAYGKSSYPLPGLYLFASAFIFAHNFFRGVFDKLQGKKISMCDRFKMYSFYVLGRYLRFIPYYFLSIGMLVTLNKWSWRNSPFKFHLLTDWQCEKYWWRNILFINNLFPYEELCCHWGWTTTVDMQFFIIVTALLILSISHFKTAAVLIAGLFLLGVQHTIQLVYNTGLVIRVDTFIMSDKRLLHDPLTRITSYLVGVYAAYFMYRFKTTLSTKKNTVRLLWMIFSCINVYLMYRIQDDVDVDFTAFYLGFVKIFWTLGIAWTVIACETGSAGIINTILSHKYWKPLSNITFTVYLNNPFVIYFVALLSIKSLYINIVFNICIVMGLIVLTYGISYITSLFLEQPFDGISKIFLEFAKKKMAKTSDSKVNKNE